MILQALNSYYERLAADPDSGMPPFGMSVENISFALVLSEGGKVYDIEDLREQDGKQLRPRKMVVPAAEKKANGIKANFLWDATGYVLGIDGKGKQERTDKCHAAFIEKVKSNCRGADDPGLKAIISFLDGGEPKTIGDRDDWSEICDSNIVFRLNGVKGYVHERPSAQKAWQDCLARMRKDVLGQCLINGTMQPIARLHPSIKGVKGSQSSGASIVSFNNKSFESYGKQQSFNAPIGQIAAFAYTTALNSLLRRNSRQKIQIGDMTLVFWAEKPSPAEDFFADLFEPSTEEPDDSQGSQDDQQTAEKIRGLLQAVRDGRPATDIIPDLDETVRFYILGLSPNAARLSIRFWEVDSFGNLLKRIVKHYQQLSIAPQFSNEPVFPPLWRLLCQTAPLGKAENVSPVLAGGMARAILTGSLYPQNLLSLVLQRIRSEHNVTYFRAALLKAFLLRNSSDGTMEVPMSLDPERTDLSYLLGRLFAVLEKAQEEAVPGANATMKDRYLASASATPGLVFHLLLKNSANHIAKLRKDPKTVGRAKYFEILTQEIVDKFNEFPSTLPAEGQGLFMIGYYHQRKEFFTKKTQED